MISILAIAFLTDSIFKQRLTANTLCKMLTLQFLIFTILRLTSTTVVLKQYLEYGDNQVNVSTYYDFLSFVMN